MSRVSLRQLSAWVLSTSSHLALCSQIRDELLDLSSVHPQRVTLIMEQYVASDRVDVTLFGAVGVMLNAQSVAYLVK